MGEVALQGRLALDLGVDVDGIEVGVEGDLGVDRKRAAVGEAQDEVGSRARLIAAARQVALNLEVAVP